MPPKGFASIAVFTLLGAAGSAVLAQGARAAADVERRYQEERAACSALAGDERRTCLREAGAARQEARRGGLTDEQAVYDTNRRARCAYLGGDDRTDCERRMRGEGTTSGSVSGGGIYRELRSVTD